MMIMVWPPVNYNAGRKSSGHDSYGYNCGAYPFQKFFAHWLNGFAIWNALADKSLMRWLHLGAV